MNYIRRAVILAAGKGKRLHPLTEKTATPLIPVHGTRMIETIIHGLHANGIYEIYIVIGHLKQQFDFLINEYPGIRLIENPFYNSCNNISSLYAARDHLENSIVLDGDQIIYNNKILAPAFEKSGYHCVWTEAPTTEWLLTAQDGIVTHCSPTGGERGWQLYSISRWTAKDARKLKVHLEIEFIQKQNKQIYWDDVPMFCYADQYRLGIYPINAGDVIEIDTLQELISLDSDYKNYLKQNSLKD